MFNPGFAICWNEEMEFIYGGGTFGPVMEKRRLEDIRKSLREPDADGPEYPYAIAMDVGKTADREDLIERNLLYGAVIYAKGCIGKEPVRSQGHIHAVSASCGYSTPEVYEIWEGEAIVYMQETAEDNPGRCYAVYGRAGDVIVVPPYWAHCTVNANPAFHMVFGAWCVRDYGFDYAGVRRHGGVAFFPTVEEGRILWERNPAYSAGKLVEKEPERYRELGLKRGIPIYCQYEKQRNLFSFVTRPQNAAECWKEFIP